MGARRFFVSGVRAEGDSVAIDDADARKIRTVLRLQPGDALELVDSSGALFAATIESTNGTVSARVDRLLTRGEPQTLRVDVAQGVPKGQKMDYVVEKLVELGVERIVPLLSERVQVEPGAAKIERWRRIAKSAAEQSGRSAIPDVSDPLAFDALIETFPAYDVVLFPWEVAASEPLREVLPSLLDGARRVLVAIGPEGGFAHDEAERAAAAGARVISLGSRVLRTETAALAVVAILQYICG